METVFLREARKTLDRLPRKLRDRIETAIELLPKGDVKRLQGRDDFRLRVGDWRVIFTMDATAITVRVVAPRGGAYR